MPCSERRARILLSRGRVDMLTARSGVSDAMEGDMNAPGSWSRSAWRVAGIGTRPGAPHMRYGCWGCRGKGWDR